MTKPMAKSVAKKKAKQANMPARQMEILIVLPPAVVL